MQRRAAGKVRQVRRQSVAGQRAGGYDDRSLRQLCGLSLRNGDVGMGADRFRDIGAEPKPVHRQRTPGSYPGGVGGAENDAVQTPQLLLQKTYGVLQTRPPQGVGAD